MVYWQTLEYLASLCSFCHLESIQSVENTSVYLQTCVVSFPVMLLSTEWVQGEDEYSRQCITVGKWIPLSLLHNWTGTCNVSQSFNSNLPWPVMGYIIINHPCQLVQTNCWVEAINRQMVLCSLYISVRPIYQQTQACAKYRIFSFTFIDTIERLWLDAAHC